MDKKIITIVGTSNMDYTLYVDCFDFKDYKKHRNEMKNTSKRRLIIDFKEKGVGTDVVLIFKRNIKYLMKRYIFQ